MNAEGPDKRKIIFLLPHLASGGAERVASTLMQHLDRRKFDVLLVVYEAKFDYPKPERTISLGLPKQSTFLGKAARGIKSFFAFRRLVRRETPDVVLSFMEGPNLINLLANRKKAVLSVHRNPACRPTTLGQRVDDLVLRFVYPQAGHLIAVSSGVAAALSALGIAEKKISVIPNPIDHKLILRQAAEEMPADLRDFVGSTPFFINIGRLSPEKGQWHLLRAFAELKKEFPHEKLVVLGDGPLRTRLEEMITALDLSKQVMLAGFRSNPFAILSRSMALVSVSLSEALPTALLEALSCGVPVLATDCPYGPREILAPDTPVSATGCARELEWKACGVLMPQLSGAWRGSSEPLTPHEYQLVQALQDMRSRFKLGSGMDQQCWHRAAAYRPEVILAKYMDLIEQVTGR